MIRRDWTCKRALSDEKENITGRHSLSTYSVESPTWGVVTTGGRVWRGKTGLTGPSLAWKVLESRVAELQGPSDGWPIFSFERKGNRGPERWGDLNKIICQVTTEQGNRLPLLWEDKRVLLCSRKTDPRKWLNTNLRAKHHHPWRAAEIMVVMMILPNAEQLPHVWHCVNCLHIWSPHLILTQQPCKVGTRRPELSRALSLPRA